MCSEQKCICRCCGALATFLWKAKLLEQLVGYYECDSCGYVQTERPSWLSRAYEEAINISDTGIMTRNLANADIVISTLALLGGGRWRINDTAGGYGILVRLLRDRGIDAMWSDPYCTNLISRGFEFDEGEVDLVTSFEAFEHFVEPDKELDRLLTLSPNVLFSTELIPEPTPKAGEWWYYGSEHGQHIGFFREKTLRMMAERRGKHLVSDGSSYHLITDKPIGELTWRNLIRLRKILSFIIRRRLKSKTWSDHLLISSNETEASQ